MIGQFHYQMRTIQSIRLFMSHEDEFQCTLCIWQSHPSRMVLFYYVRTFLAPRSSCSAYTTQKIRHSIVHHIQGAKKCTRGFHMCLGARLFTSLRELYLYFLNTCKTEIAIYSACKFAYENFQSIKSYDEKLNCPKLK